MILLTKFCRLSILLLIAITLTGCSQSNGSKAATLVASCSLDEVNGGQFEQQSTFSIPLKSPDMILRGWLANNLAGISPEEVIVVIADSTGQIYSSKGGKPKSRPDVASAYKKPGMANSGFEILMENVSKPGTYTITMQGEFKNDILVCSRAYTLNVMN